MEIKIEPDFGKLVKAFEEIPEETTNQLRSGLKIAVRDIQEYASDHHNYTSRSGILEREGIVTKVEGNVGTVMLNPSVPYAQYVHEGTRRHKIRIKKKSPCVGRLVMDLDSLRVLTIQALLLTSSCMKLPRHRKNMYRKF